MLEFRQAPFPTGNGLVTLHCALSRRTPTTAMLQDGSRSVQAEDPACAADHATDDEAELIGTCNRRTCKYRPLTIDQPAASADLSHPFLSQREHRATTSDPHHSSAPRCDWPRE